MDRQAKRRELIYFGVLLIFASLSILVDEDKLLINFLSINATWSLKLLYFTFAGTLYFMLKFIKCVFNIKNFMFQLLFSLYITAVIALMLFPGKYIIDIGYFIMLLN